MEIKGKIYCFFEQSGTFKNEFRKLGYEAEDYDIQNEYGETDNICDLFAEIERGYDGKPSIFDEITPDDLVLAFFPCIYFCEMNAAIFSGDWANFKGKGMDEIERILIEREQKRADFYILLLKMFNICTEKGIRLIVENPYSPQHYLYGNFPHKPAFVDKNRQIRGDFYVKPTQYWFHNCKPTSGRSETNPAEKRIVRHSKSSNRGGVCSKERSEISPDYARNFICDFIIGKVQDNTLPTLF